MRFTECIIKLLENFSICHNALQTSEDYEDRTGCKWNGFDTWLLTKQRLAIFVIVQCSALL